MYFEIELNEVASRPNFVICLFSHDEIENHETDAVG